jgi:hypothetical protein
MVARIPEESNLADKYTARKIFDAGVTACVKNNFHKRVD